MHLTSSTIASILETASPHIHCDRTGASFSLLCTVEEGIACRFTTSQWGDPSLVLLAQQIIDELGWNIVAHSLRRQVVLRCKVPGRDPAKARCECDRGDGFQPLLLA